MDLHAAIRSQNYDLFTQLIVSGADITQLDQHQNTVLHTLAATPMKSSTASDIKSLFTFQPSMIDWLVKIRDRAPSQDMTSFALVQNKKLETCMHIAITCQNWWFATLVQRDYLQYFLHPSRFRRNELGLNEYEYFLFNYGFNGQKEELVSIFAHYVDSHTMLTAIKTAAKSVKLINTGEDKIYLHVDHELFSKAIEEDYPSPYASFESERDLTSLCKEKGVVDPNAETIKYHKKELIKLISSISNQTSTPELSKKLLLDLMEFLYSRGMRYQEQKNYIRSLYNDWRLPRYGDYGTKMHETIVDFKEHLNKQKMDVAYIYLLDKMINAWK